MDLKNLIIDDDEVTLLLAEILARGHPFFEDATKFLDGTYALAYLKQNYSEDHTYAIILDINMPLMDGWEFLENIEPFVSSKNTFVFILSSSTNQTDIEKSKNNGLVKGYFSKPLKTEHLNEIQQLVSQ